MIKQNGQVILILILVMTVALAIGISVIQRSLSDVSTSTKVEQSSRAFSAAEAGIEKALQADSAIGSVTLDNNAQIQSVEKNAIPQANQALEYPPLSKEETAQVWLVNPETLGSPYTGNVDVYWGNSARNASDADAPAFELTLIYLSTANTYKAKKYLFDYNSTSRNNGFISSGVSTDPAPLDTSSGTNRSFKFKRTVDLGIGAIPDLSKPILLRAKLLYTNVSDAFAVKPISGSLPVQARIFTSTGVSGETQRKVQLFKLDKVVPFYFDYAIFSAGDITKN